MSKKSFDKRMKAIMEMPITLEDIARMLQDLKMRIKSESFHADFGDINVEYRLADDLISEFIAYLLELNEEYELHKSGAPLSIHDLEDMK